jgi:hypothetical protein
MVYVMVEVTVMVAVAVTGVVMLVMEAAEQMTAVVKGTMVTARRLHRAKARHRVMEHRRHPRPVMVPMAARRRSILRASPCNVRMICSSAI